MTFRVANHTILLEEIERVCSDYINNIADFSQSNFDSERMFFFNLAEL